MKRVKVFVFWVGVFVVAAVTVAGASGVRANTDSKGKSSAVARGRSVYEANCARCHGGDGTSHTTMGEMTQAPNLTDAAWQSRHSTSRMISSVSNGRGDMPAFKKKLSARDIAAAVAFVRTLKR
jgi:cbb3-type cytochrome c oxidase subunit III